MTVREFEISREQRIELLVDPGGIGEDRVAAGVRQLMRKQRRERRRIRTEPAVGVPDVVAQVLVLERVDHGRVRIFRRARRVRSRIVEELTEEAGERREVLGGHGAGLEDHQAAVVQEVAQRRTELVAERTPVEPEAGNDRAERRLDLRYPHPGRHRGFRHEPDRTG